jgi:hypothetical protein
MTFGWDDIKLNLQELECGDVDWNQLAHNSEH